MMMMRYVKSILAGLIVVFAAFSFVAIVGANQLEGVGFLLSYILHTPSVWAVLFLLFALGFWWQFRRVH
jgi:hypothetical protein